jgi:hypothetical protein
LEVHRAVIGSPTSWRTVESSGNAALTVRGGLLAEHALTNLEEPIRESPTLEARPPDLIGSVKARGLDGLVAKRLDSRYEPGQPGAWHKMRVNQGQASISNVRVKGF